MNLIEKNGLKINSKIFEFINEEVLPETGIKSEDFWNKFEKIVHELAPINKNLIEKRETIQKKIDEWHKKNKGKNLNKKEYTDFLNIDIEGMDFTILKQLVPKKINPQLISIETHSTENTKLRDCDQIYDFLKSSNYVVLDRAGQSTLFKLDK